MPHILNEAPAHLVFILPYAAPPSEEKPRKFIKFKIRQTFPLFVRGS